MSTSRQFSRAATVAAAVSAFGLLTASVAAAHVTANVYGSQPEQGGYTAITMRVPNEDEKAGTNKLTVHFDEAYGFARIRTKPVPGWSAKVTKSKLDKPIITDDGAKLTEVVTEVTWTAANGSEVKAGETEYQEFSFSAGPLPTDTDTLVLPADQGYTDGKVVKWEQEGEDAERPAPTVALAEPSGDGHGGSEKVSAETNGGHDEESASEAQAPADTTARWLGGLGLAVGALGAGFGVGAILRSRKKTT